MPSRGWSPARSTPPHSDDDHEADRDLARAPVEPAARDQVGREPEHDPARTDVDACPRAPRARCRDRSRSATIANTARRRRAPSIAIRSPMITNGIVFPSRWPKPTCRNGAVTIPVEPLRLARLDPVLVELVVGQHVHDLDGPHHGHEREQDLCGVTQGGEPYPWRRMATAPEQKPSIAPIVGPDDERRFTDSGIEIKHATTPRTSSRISRSASASPASYPFTRGIHPDMYRGRTWTMRQYAGLRERQGDERALPLPDRARLDRPVDGVRPPHPARPRLRRPALHGRGRPHRRGHRHDRRHAAGLRRDPARPGLHVDDDQRARRGAAAPLRARRRGAGRAGRAAHAARRRTTC